MLEFKFQIEGMHCASCVNRLEKQLSQIQGVQHVNVNLANEQAHVQAQPSVQTNNLLSCIEQAGFKGTLLNQNDPYAKIRPTPAVFQKWRVSASVVLTLPLLIPMIPKLESLMLPNSWQALLTTIVQFILGFPLLRGAWVALKTRHGNMDLLVTLGSLSAFGLSIYMLFNTESKHPPHLYFEAGASVVTFVMLGKWLEHQAKQQTTHAISALQNLRPDVAHIQRNNTFETRPVSEIQLGDILLIKAGEHIPADGQVIQGNSEVNESLLTGESLPVSKTIDSLVKTGSINTHGILHIQVQATGSNTLLAQIIHLVENAQTIKAPIQRLADQISGIFVPIVLSIALLTFIGWMLYTGHIEQAIIHAVSVLVIACPCALGLATPTAIMVGTGVAAQHGILIRDGQVLETTHKINCVVLDKTGTLTEGKPRLIAYQPTQRISNSHTLLQWAASLQNYSEHPLAQALLNEARHQNLSLFEPNNTQTLIGKGLSGFVQNQHFLMGNTRLMNEHQVNLEELTTQAQEFSKQGYTISWLAQLNNEPENTIPPTLLGLLVFGDTLKSTSASTIAQLKAQGIHTVMLTGDNIGSAQHINQQLGIDAFQAEVLPQNKAIEIKQLQKQGYTVAMVGDGINDAPALALADVGIAMSTGTDIAMQTAGITLMRGDPALILHALQLSMRTWNKIRQNLFWALIYNAIGIPLAAFGLLNPMLASVAMALSSISVVCNALLLKRWKPNDPTPPAHKPQPSP